MAHLGAFRAQVEAHARFFDHLVELVPAKHYVEREEQPANLKYLKKVRQKERTSTATAACWAVLLQPHPAMPSFGCWQSVRESEKQRLREVGKARKRARLNPEEEQPMTLDSQRQQAATPAAGHGAASGAPRLQLGACGIPAHGLGWLI